MGEPAKVEDVVPARLPEKYTLCSWSSLGSHFAFTLDQPELPFLHQIPVQMRRRLRKSNTKSRKVTFYRIGQMRLKYVHYWSSRLLSLYAHKDLELVHSRIGSLDELRLARFSSHLKRLCLRQNHISFLDPEVFHLLSKLEELDLYDNKIKDPGHALDKLSNLSLVCCCPSLAHQFIHFQHPWSLLQPCSIDTRISSSVISAENTISCSKPHIKDHRLG